VFILGISAFGHEASAALLKDGVLIAMAEEERFNREKHSAAYPVHAIDYCLAEAGITLADIDHVAFFLRPLTWLMTQLFSGVVNLPASLNLLRGGNSAYPIGRRVQEMFLLKQVILKQHPSSATKFKVHFIDHHLAHAASSFLISKYDRAAVLSIDGWGDRASTLIAHGRGNILTKRAEVKYPHSLGGLYSAVTQYLGFRTNSDEYKVMGMAAFGRPEYYDAFKKMIRFTGPGQFELDLDYFAYHTHGHSKWYSDKFVETFGPAATNKNDFSLRAANIAASVQQVVEEAILQLARDARELTGESRLCYTGGVALNCLANRRILGDVPSGHLFIQPVANDAGTSLGAAVYLHFHLHPNAPRRFVWESPYWGPAFDQEQCRAALDRSGLPYRASEAIHADVARRIAEGKVVGWFQGRMEAGPRALGNRSLLADPRRGDMKDLLNIRVKKREEFRPFAPSVLEERAAEFFDLEEASPYMIMVANVRIDKRSIIPAVTHVDGTARVHTVNRGTNPAYWALIDAFGKITGVPVLLNTSFNENEPIVCTPDEAIGCFRRTQIDVLALGNFIVDRENLNA
jgi:carbamoyltransferase